MALDRNAKYSGRYEAPTPAQPQGAFKNRTSPTSQDGSYMEKDWLNDWSAFFSSLLVKAGITPNGDVDEVGASQYMDAFEQLVAGGEVSPINNDWNGYFDPTHQEQLPSPAGYPADSGSGGTVYGAGDEWSLNCFSTTSANTISSDVDGVIFSGSIEKRYTFTAEQIALIDVNKVPVYIKDQDGKEYFFKNNDTGVTVSKLGTTLTVTLSNAIFTVTGITKVWRFFVTESVGSVVELNPSAMIVKYLSSQGFDFSQNGYQIFDSGLIIQWGTCSEGSNNLPITFPNVFSSVVTTVQGAGSYNVGNSAQVDSLSSFSYQFGVQSGDGAYYLALGY